MRAGLGFVLALALGASLPALGHDGADCTPNRYSVWSRNGRYLAEIDPRRMETTVYRMDKGGDRVALWSIDGWYRVAYLADDGEHLVIGSNTFGLVPVDYDPHDGVLWIFRHGHLVHSVSLAEVVPDPKDLLRTSSYYDWGHYVGFDESGLYELERVDGTRVRIDVGTGRLIAVW